MHNGPFGKRLNSIAVFRAQEAGTQEQRVRCLKAYILKTIALNQKNILNLLTNFLRSFQIHKDPTSDMGTLNFLSDFHVFQLMQFFVLNPRAVIFN